MLRRLGVRGKILAVLAVPVLVLVIGAAVLSISALRDSRAASASEQLIDTFRVQDEFLAAVQAERRAAFAYISTPDGAEAFEASQAETDAKARQLDARVADLDTSQLDSRIVDALDAAQSMRSSGRMVTVRSVLQPNTFGQMTRLHTQYTSVISPQLAVLQTVADVTANRQLGLYLDAYASLERAIDYIDRDGGLGEVFFSEYASGEITEQLRRDLAVEISRGDEARTEARTAVADLDRTDLEVPRAGSTYGVVRGAISFALVSTATEEGRAQWLELTQGEIDELVPVRDEVRDASTQIAADTAAAATRTTFLTIAAVLLGVLLSIAAALLIARRITVPLRHLTASAADVRDALPRLVDEMIVPGQVPSTEIEPILVESGDEIGQLATAFNEVNETTLNVARQQAALRGSIAEMFVNVARRDQVLLGRQLAFLDDLERSEEDPGTLANLFRLDHLATRMRRNAESLLVLAGIESGRRVRQPMPLSNVIRTASSEIELYDRVQLELDHDPMVLGHNALVTAHLLAELLENATVYSEPGTPVRVSVEQHPHWITVVVRDQGLGMSPEDIEVANEKASTFASSEIVGAQRLGLYVVGRLSHRLGARVRFSSVQDDGETGTEVRVSLPRALFIAESDVPLTEPTDPLDSDTRAAAEAWVTATAEASVAVDIESLTDGATTTGMPRRRSRTADPQAPAPSEALADAQPLLPELTAPEVPASFVSDAEVWTPPATADAGPVTLPSRARATRPAADAADQSPTPPAPVPARASMFTSFRARRELPELGALDEEPLAPDAQPAEEPAEPAPAPVVSSQPEFVVPDLVPDDDYSSAATATLVAEQPVPEQVPAARLEVEPVAPIVEDLPDAPAEPEVVVTTGAHTAPVAIVPPPADQGEELLVRRRARHIRLEDEDASDQAPSTTVPETPGAFAVPSLEHDAAYLFNPAPEAAPGLPQEREPVGTEPVPQDQADPLATGADLFATGVAEHEPAPADGHALSQQEGVAEPATTLGQMAAIASVPAIDTTVPEFSDVLALPKRSAVAGTAAPRRGLFGMFRRRRGQDSDGAATPVSAQATGPAFGQAFAPVPTASEPGAERVAAPPVAQTFEPEPVVDTVAAPAAFLPGPAEAVPDDHGHGFEPEPLPAAGATFASAAFFSRTREAESEAHVEPAPVAEPDTGWERDQAIAQLATAYVPETSQAGWAPAAEPSEDGGGFGQAVSRGPGSIDLETSARIALQAGIQEQALAELSRLSSYRPSQVAGGESGGLTRRVRSHVPETTPTDEGSQRISRDAAELRSRLSSFVNATSRGRQAVEDGPVPTPDTDNHLHPASDIAPQSR